MSAEAPATCPFHAAVPGARRALGAAERLVLPDPRSAVVQRLDGPEGVVLHVFHGDKELAFDDPRFFAFAEGLVRAGDFAAHEACTWGTGYAWSEVAPLLEELLSQRVLRRADELPPPAPRADGRRASPLPPAPNTHPRSWDDCETLMAELTGRALEPGWLEVVVPVFRVAHMALDGDGRQVGEANVFPPALRLPVETNWRTCIYPGTRHQTERPMNVTALKAMRQHWPAMMALLGPVRSEYLRRFPEARAGWTVGHLERLATAVLGLATWPLVKPHGRVPNGALHPALSSLFRVTDGLRMTMHQMLFVPIGEPTLPPQAPMTAAAVHDYAERNHSFHSEHGVCAGPQAMVQEFLSVLVDGAAPPAGAPLDAALQAALADLPQAVDYALRGLKVYAATFSLWPLMTRSLEALGAAADAWQARSGRPAVTALAATLRGHVRQQREATYLAQESWRADREAVYADMHAQCAAGLGERVPPLPALYAAARDDADAAVVAQVHAVLQAHAGESDEAFARAAAAFLLSEQALLRVAAQDQAALNTLLQRPAPRRPLDARDLDLHNQLQGAAPRRVPDLAAELGALLGARLELNTARLVIEAVPQAVAA